MPSLNPSVFEKTSRQDLPCVLWDHILELSQTVPSNQHMAFIEGLPLGLRIVHAVTVFQGELENGGVAQLFYNQTPHDIVETITALNRIGATQSADLLTRAARFLEVRYEWPRGSRERWLVRTYDVPDVDALSDEYFDNDNSRNDYDCLAQYLKEHANECLSNVTDS